MRCFYENNQDSFEHTTSQLFWYLTGLTSKRRADAALICVKTAIKRYENLSSSCGFRIGSASKNSCGFLSFRLKNTEIFRQKALRVYTPNPQDQNDIDRQFNNWWQKKSKEYFQEQINRLFPIIEKHGICMPNLVVRKMQTLWGSCSRRNHTVNLNYYLYKAPVPCIEYVILHELAHFLYPRHDQNFHDFITIYMPDWQERKRLLDYEIVLGI